MKKINLIFCVIIFFFILFDTSFSQTFQIMNGEIEGMANGSVNWVDVNNDGYLDVFVCGRSKFNLPVSELYLNNNGTGFVPSNFEFAPVTFGSASWGDYDNDGDLDLLLTGYSSDERQSFPVTRIYRNDFPQGFTDINANLINVYKGSAIWGDYDSDGDLDLIISGLKSNGRATTKVYRNDGDGNFIMMNINIEPVYKGSLTLFDFDNDGDNDLLVTGLNNRNPSQIKIVTKLYENLSGNFVETNVDLTPVYNSSVSCGDFNSDGTVDLILTGINELGNIVNPSCVTNIYKNDGGLNFYNVNADLPGIHSGLALWGDYDNDGDLDILLSGSEQNSRFGSQPVHTTTIYNNSRGVFESTNNILLDSLSDCSAAWGDYDNDSDLDIIIAGHDNVSEVTRIYNNQCEIINNLPVEPEGLTTTVDINYETDWIIFVWKPSFDNETLQKGLTYNLRVGTTSGGCEIMSPNSNIRNGAVTFPTLGNVGYNKRWYIRGLQPGEYFWSVQCVDNIFKGSSFAPEQTFIVTNSIGITKINSLIPEDFSLAQNYPNPFNPETRIRFSIPKSSFVNVVVYDVNGKEIAQLVNHQLTPGNYEYHWSATDLSSGIYFYRIKTEDYTNTKKMVLLK